MVEKKLGPRTTAKTVLDKFNKLKFNPTQTKISADALQHQIKKIQMLMKGNKKIKTNAELKIKNKIMEHLQKKASQKLK
jgi:hypothetical protein